MLKLMYITNDPRVARIAVDAGVDRIFIDMEVLGKQERQGHMDSVKSFHTFEDIQAVRTAIGQRGELLVRVNPLHEGTAREIDRAIECGADIIMLPMWRSAQDIRTFVSLVGGRARTMALLETKEADEALEEVLTIAGLDEIHIGLNDLHLSYGRCFLFELLADGTVDRLCALLRRSGKRYGFGGFGRPGSGMLPAQYILGEHIRLGSGIAILSRSFCNTALITDYDQIHTIFEEGVADVRRWEAEMEQWSEEALLCNHSHLAQCVEQILRARS